MNRRPLVPQTSALPGCATPRTPRVYRTLLCTTLAPIRSQPRKSAPFPLSGPGAGLPLSIRPHTHDSHVGPILPRRCAYSGGLEVPSSNLSAPIMGKPCSSGVFFSAAFGGIAFLGGRKVPKRLERRPGAVDRVGQKVAVGAVNLLHRRAHEAGELEQTDTRRDRPSGEGVSKGIGRAVREPSGLPTRAFSSCLGSSSRIGALGIPIWYRFAAAVRRGPPARGRGGGRSAASRPAFRTPLFARP